MTPIVDSWSYHDGSTCYCVQADDFSKAIEAVLFQLREADNDLYTVEFVEAIVHRKPPGLVVKYKFAVQKR